MSTVSYKNQPAIQAIDGHITQAMSTVSYRNQPAMQAIKSSQRGVVPPAGTTHPYTVNAVLWPGKVEEWIAARLLGRTLHICCGKSLLGDCRVDLYEKSADVAADAARLPFPAHSWDTVLIDPPYNGRFQWNHDMLTELARVARQRIIFQHWFLPVDRQGQFKKSHAFWLVEVAVWQPRTYFGRVQVISVMDRLTELSSRIAGHDQ